MTHFDTALFDFLSELKANNSRQWFQANKERYRAEVQDPLLEFISAFTEPLHEISPHFVANPKPVGGSMFRIYRDVRFSRDKSPYKTHAAAQFRHREGRDVHAPGFYLHLEPGSVFMGAGLWHPPGPTLKSVRKAIDEQPERWRDAIRGLELGGDSLTRAPKGYDPGHPMIVDLRRKDFVTMTTSSQKAACSKGFMDDFVGACREAAPMMRFLTEAVGLEF
jgi:uncharacterized protein (TIGR02453 family)